MTGPAWEQAGLAWAEAATWQVLSAKCADGTGGTLQIPDTGYSWHLVKVTAQDKLHKLTHTQCLVY